ncbi:hypothetical protein CV717_28405 [Bacillus cereus]|nr:hypothetical protein CV717_28405 [Bacillus cereus]
MNIRISVQEFQTSVADGGYAGGRTISNATGLLALSFLVQADVEQLFFSDDGEPLTEAQVDDLKSIVAQAFYELINSEEFSMLPIGFVIPYAGITGALTDDFLLCDGSMYLRTAYPALYDILETNFIIDVDNFIVPDLNEKFVRGAEAGIGDTGGLSVVTLDVDEMPAHTHKFTPTAGQTWMLDTTGPPPPGAFPDVGWGSSPGSGTWAFTIANNQSSGGGDAHENKPPFQNLRYYIKAR